MKAKLALIGLAAALSQTAAFAAAGDVWNPGAGSKSCSTWSDDHQHASPAGTLQSQWLLGFLSAGQWFGGEPKVNDYIGTIDNDALITWMSDICSKHPELSIPQGADQLWIELKGKAFFH